MSRRTDVVALAVDGADDLTYGAWEERSNALARGLAARAVRAGDRVALLFDAAGWATFAVAHLGVRKAGAVAVHLSPGAAPPDLVRAVAHADPAGLLCPPHLAVSLTDGWVARPADVERGHDTEPLSVRDAEELVYPAAPFAPASPRPWVDADLAVDGRIVHAWAPGTFAGRWVVGMALAGPGVATVAAFDPHRLCSLVDRREAATLGLTPALAAALLASEAPRRYDLSSLRHLVLSGPPTAELRAALTVAFRGVAVAELPTPAASVVEAAPVAVSQDGMLWHEQFTPGSFNLPCLVRRYEGPLDVPALERALAELARRHQPLRSTFTLVGGEPGQVVADHRPPRLAVLDLRTLPAGDRDAEAARVIADATSRPFDLTAGPLFEPHLLRRGVEDHVLVVRLHHTVFDDWSVDLFRRELSALYSAALDGGPTPLVEPAVSFADHCRRQRARLAGAQGEAERAWWRQELAGAPLAVQLPIGPGGGAGQGEPVRLDLPPALAAAIRALAPQLRATPFITVLAAFSVLLARVTRQHDLLIATVVAHRDRTDVEPLIGCFTKKVPLRLRVDEALTFPELVAGTRASLLGALSHQGPAFDATVQDGLGPAASVHGVVPQISVVFQGETPQQVGLSLPGLRTGPYEVHPGARRERHFSAGPEEPVDEPVWGDGIYLGTFLILSLQETTGGMALVARGVFDRAAARGLLEDFRTLLSEVVADPSRAVASWPGTPQPPDDDVIELRGFRASRPRLEGALARCPGVAEVAVAVRGDDPRLIAHVVPEREPAPTLAQLRRALWRDLPGAVWPAEAVIVDALPAAPGAGRPAGHGAGGTAAMMAAMWAESAGKPVGTETSYWQDFSFLPVLAEAREAGLPLADEDVVRCRTPEMLAALIATRPPR